MASLLATPTLDLPTFEEAIILKRLFDYLHDEHIPYCVLGDRTGLPDVIDGDIDLVVAPSVLERLAEVLTDFCSAIGASLVQMIHHEPTAYFCVLAWGRPDGSYGFLQVDICSDYYRNGRRLLEARNLLEGRYFLAEEDETEKGFYVAAPAQEFIYYLLKKVEKGLLDSGAADHLSRRWHEDKNGACRELSRFWSGPELTILQAAGMHHEWKPVVEILPRLKTLLHQSVRIPIKQRWAEVRRKVQRLVRPTGLFVVFMGPDGAGKSTIIREVVNHLNPVFWTTTTMHLRPSLGRQIDATPTPVTDPHAQEPRGRWMSMLKMLYYLADYVIGYLIRVLPKRAQASMVIFDRYYHDIMIDPKRYRYGGPEWLVRLLARFIPQPDLFVFLDVDPEIAQARKQEVSFEETRRQRAAYRLLAAGHSRRHLVDAGRSVREVTGAVEKLIIEHMTRRMQHRLNESGGAV